MEKYGVTADLPYSGEPERKDCPPGYIEHDNPEQRADDIDRVITCLRANYNYAGIIVTGGSEGAVVALLLASNKDKDELDKNIDFRWYEGYNHSLNLSVPDNSSDRIIRDVQKWLSGKI